MLSILLNNCKKDLPDPPVNIPDHNFSDALIRFGVDVNHDGKISHAEAEAISYLKVNNCFIQDLTGIEAFINLDTLYCRDNDLTKLDVSACTVLKLLSCSMNRLTTLDILKNSALEELYCYNNQIKSLDVSSNTVLTVLSCGSNQLSALDVSNNNALIKLSCVSNSLTSLDVSNCSVLDGLACSSNQLTSLDISNNDKIVDLFIENLPDLYKICVWEIPFPPAGVNVYMEGSPNIYFAAEGCSGSGD
jgi:Leucine-rich repeat (LRR) protein